YPDAVCIGIDIPIGLSTSGPRECDLLARRLLGKRGASVFAAPDPRLLDCATHAEASALSRELTGKGISIQCFGIVPKIREVDWVMTPALQRRVVEVHPEVAFLALAGHPLLYSKKRLAGFGERRSLLASALSLDIPDRKAIRLLAPPAVPDDVLDALAVAW